MKNEQNSIGENRNCPSIIIAAFCPRTQCSRIYVTREPYRNESRCWLLVFSLFFYRNMIAWWNSLIWQILYRIFWEKKISSIISKELRVSFYEKKRKTTRTKRKKNKKRSVYDETSSTVVVSNKSTNCLWETRGSSLYAKYLPAWLFCKRNFLKTWFEKRSHPFCSAGLCNEMFAPVSTIMHKNISYFFFGGRLSSEFSFFRTFNDVSKATEAWTL